MSSMPLQPLGAARIMELLTEVCNRVNQPITDDQVVLMTGALAVLLEKVKKEERMKVVRKLRSSAFMHCNVNPRAVLLCIEYDAPLLDASKRWAAEHKVVCTCGSKEDNPHEHPRHCALRAWEFAP